MQLCSSFPQLAFIILAVTHQQHSLMSKSSIVFFKSFSRKQHWNMFLFNVLVILEMQFLTH